MVDGEEEKQLPGVKWFMVSLQRRAGGWALSDAVCTLLADVRLPFTARKTQMDSCIDLSVC